MERLRPVRLVLPAVLFVAAAIATPDQSTPEFDQTRWELIKRASVRFVPDASACEVLLLKSRKATGSSGAGEPLYDVDLLLQQGGKALYEYAERRTKDDTPFYMDDYLDIRDVTGDRVPAVLFHSGTQGASDFVINEHILRYDHSTESVKDIALDIFYQSGTHGLRWLTLRDRTLVVIADRNWPASTPIQERCHYCASPFQYDLYAWSSEQRAFLVRGRIYSDQSYEYASQALTGEWDLIQQSQH